MKTFAIIWVWWYIAPRHMKAIKETWNNLIAAIDKHDSVWIMDSYFPDADFFTEFELFYKHLKKLINDGQKIDYISICSPNYLHDAHIRFALEIWAIPICEKPLVLEPKDLEELEKIEKSKWIKANTILQLRLHPAIIELKEKIAKTDRKYDIDLCYITSRWKRYDASRKGEDKKSWWVINNIGIHFFDMLTRIFGDVKDNKLHISKKHKAAWIIELERAKVRRFLSIDSKDLPQSIQSKWQKTYRSILIEWEELEFSEWFTDLHTESYKKIINNEWFELSEAKISIKLVDDIKKKTPIGLVWDYHPILNDIII